MVFEPFVRYGVTVALLATPVFTREYVIGSELFEVLSATTVSEPLPFLNAVISTALLEVLAPTRTAPGRM